MLGNLSVTVTVEYSC